MGLRLSGAVMVMVLAVLALSACKTEGLGSSSSAIAIVTPMAAARPDPAVLERFAGLTECGELQAEFDVAHQEHAREIGLKRYELARVHTAYMTALHQRMVEVRCPGS